jgi:predicted NBD/HSP70 family sugar kinase
VTKKELLVLRVMELISREGVVSRTKIARSLKLSKATVSHITRQLIDYGIVAELDSQSGDESRSRSGRRAVPLQIKPESGLLIGVDLSGSRIVGVVLNMALEQHARLEFDYPALVQPIMPSQVIMGVIDGMMTTLGTSSVLVRGIGISVRALNYQDTESGSTSLMDEEANAQLVEALNARYHTAVRVVHNMQALLVAEMMDRPSSHLAILIHIGEGIGGAIWFQNKPIEGAHMAAGEWGHITVDPAGTLCPCGKRGCIEALYAVPRLISRAHALDHRIANWTDFVEHMHKTPCRSVLEEFAEVAARALAPALLMADPQEIIVNGPICDVAEVFIPAFSRALHQYLLPRTRRAIAIIVSAAGMDAAARGAACLLVSAALEELVSSTPLAVQGHF